MEGYIQKLSNGKVKRYVQFLEISDDPELMAQYRYWHSEEHHWQEAMSRLATLPRQAEWEAFVARFQGCSADACSDEKWQQAERIFQLYED